MIRRTPPRRAFTLIESMATIVVLGTLASVSSLLIFNSVDGYKDGVTAAQLTVESSSALDRAVRELRRIPLDGTAPPSSPHIDDINAAGDSIQWRDSADLNCSLIKSANDLMLEVAGTGSAVLLSDVTGFSVIAYQDDNTPLTNPLTGSACDDIRRVTISVTVTRDGVSRTLRTKVFIRSTMSGGGA